MVFKEMGVNKRIALFLLISGICFLAGSNAYAVTTYTYTFTPTNLSTLTDGSFDLWDIHWTPPSGQTIISATLYINNIYDNDGDPNNLLSIFLDNYKNPSFFYLWVKQNLVIIVTAQLGEGRKLRLMRHLRVL